MLRAFPQAPSTVLSPLHLLSRSFPALTILSAIFQKTLGPLPTPSLVFFGQPHFGLLIWPTVTPHAGHDDTGRSRNVPPFRPPVPSTAFQVAEGRAPHAPQEKPFALSQGFPREAIRARITNPAEGRAPHARKERHRLDPGHVPPRPPGRRLCLGHHDIPRACVRPVFTGAETAPLRENRLSRHLGPFPDRPFPPLGPPAEGRAPHAR
jgi:hypothetical protein